MVESGFGKEAHKVHGKKNLRVLTLNAEAGKTYTFHKYFAVFTDNDCISGPVTKTAIGRVREAKALGYETCLQSHNAEWAKKWALCDVKIEGDDEAQLALRYSIFQLLMVAPVDGSANSIPARALSGQVYKGRDFLGHGDVHVSVLSPHLSGKGGRIDALPDQDAGRRAPKSTD